MRLIIILAAIPMALLFQGCKSVRDIGSQSPYSEMIGEKFVLEQDCYIFRFKDKRDTLFVANSSMVRYLPDIVSLELAQKKYKNVEIVGIIGKGSVFTVVACMEEKSPEDIFQRFKATFDNPSFNGEIIDVSYLTDLTKTPPEFEAISAKPLE
ncbi:MAG TPA: hypothetical protein VK810_02695 [Dongiaceae bacterium]|nr:hypothetical protein [Dongiaceae bacterium]